MKLESYDKYRDSDSEWVDKIPTHWEMLNPKRMFEERVEKGKEGELLSVTQDLGVVRREDLEISVWNPQGDTSNYKYVHSGDFVISLRSFQGGLELSDIEGLVSPAYTILKPILNIDNSYYKWLMKSKPFIAALNLVTTGIRQGKNINFDDFVRLRLVNPPLEEQKAIDKFLSIECSKIDELLNKQSEIYELLKEKRQSVISRAVTKGLNENAIMKNSGVDWLGDIPEDWEVVRIKHLGDCLIGITYGPEDIVEPEHEDAMLVLRASNIQNNKLSLLDNVYIKRRDVKKQRLLKGDILICSRNGSRKLIGKNIQIGDRCEGETFGAFMTVLRSRYNNFLSYFLKSDIFKSQSGAFMTSTINQLTTGTLGNMKVALPPKDQQEEIVSFLTQRLEEIDSLMVKSIEMKKLLEEKRSSLISSVVLGKIKVNKIQG